MTLQNGERLSRFLKQSNHFKGGKATHRAFMPPPDGELSTYQTDDLDDAAVRELAVQNVLPEMPLGKSIYGRADLTAAGYCTHGLVCTRDDNPERHTTVTGWPVGFPDDKEAQKEIALELADAALLGLFDAPVTR